MIMIRTRRKRIRLSVSGKKHSISPLMVKPATEPEILKIQTLPVEQLLLDAENPRLESVVKTNDQVELARAMWREMAVSEVALSIAQNGFFEEEPLFAIRGPKVDGKQRYIA